MPSPKGTDHNPPTIDREIGGISTDHNYIIYPTMTGVAAVMEGTHYAPHPATTAAYATLQLTDAFITTCIKTHPTAIIASIFNMPLLPPMSLMPLFHRP